MRRINHGSGILQPEVNLLDVSKGRVKLRDYNRNRVSITTGKTFDPNSTLEQMQKSQDM